jgi:tetratricopeptide (TPR) repeat protein
MRPRRSVLHAEESGSCRDFALLVGRVVALVVSLAGTALAQEPTGTPTSREALELCHRAQAEPHPDPLLSRSLELADQATSADDADALAYFARFCALGEQARRSGASLSSLVKIWAIRAAVDRTLELAPQFPDALYGKGALLVSLPRLLGGDSEAGDKLVVRALEIDPDYVGARLFRAESLAKNGQHDAARAEAERALAAAERKGDQEGVGAARKLLTEPAAGD